MICVQRTFHLVLVVPFLRPSNKVGDTPPLPYYLYVMPHGYWWLTWCFTLQVLFSGHWRHGLWHLLLGWLEGCAPKSIQVWSRTYERNFGWRYRGHSGTKLRHSMKYFEIWLQQYTVSGQEDTLNLFILIILHYLMTYMWVDRPMYSGFEAVAFSITQWPHHRHAFPMSINIYYNIFLWFVCNYFTKIHSYYYQNT